METILFSLSVILMFLNVLPLFNNQHWFFRVWDFGKIQLTILCILVFGANFIFKFHNEIAFYIIQSLLLLSIIYNCVLLIPYTILYGIIINRKVNQSKNKNVISLLSVNVYQYNKNHHKLISLINEVKPDFILTMESNIDWQNALKAIEIDYSFSHKVCLENTYGMHFYSKVKIASAKTNYFVADDIPSFEIILETSEGNQFMFFGVHPPPPSPVEEENSKERDGELLSIAKKVKEIEMPLIVCGDFNNVAWSKSSRLFKNLSGLIDPRIGLGFISTFHAKYKLLRFPIDLFFHSNTVKITSFKTLKAIDSDHLPVFCQFYIDFAIEDKSDEEITKEEIIEAEKIIKEGKKEKGDR